MTQQANETRDPEAIREQVEETQERLAEAVEHVAYHKGNIADDAKDAVKDKAVDAKDQLVETAVEKKDHLMETIAGKKDELKEAVVDKKEQLRAAAAEKAEELQGTVEEKRQEPGEYSSTGSENDRGKAAGLTDQVKQKVSSAVHGAPGTAGAEEAQR